jgi:tripartite-type tricarboxylate transporter receptor subunit TctC
MLIAPAGVPREAAEALNRALVATLAEPAVRERMILAGHLPPEGDNSLAHARAFIIREAQFFREVVATTGVRLEP